MGTKDIKPLDEERPFELHELFFSTTDSKGIVRHGNEVFTRISGYDESELIGAPHNIIRHPDMPRCVFRLLWDYIQAGKTIAAYVKNMASDGRYYWVLATVMPCPGGYLSIRLKPSSPVFETVQRVYRETLAIEHQVETSPELRKQSMDAGLAYISEQLQSLGFENYDAFMWAALSMEIGSRHTKLSEGDGLCARPTFTKCSSLGDLHATCSRIESYLQRLFEGLHAFRSLNEKLIEKSASIMDMADSIYTLSLNATIAAYRTGQTGSILAVAAEELGARTADNEQIIHRLVTKMQEFAPALGELTCRVAIGKLQSEVSCYYIEELMRQTQSSNQANISKSLDILLDQLTQRTGDLGDRMKSCEKELSDLSSLFAELKRNAKALRFVQFAGIKESQQQDNCQEFELVFREVRDEIQRTKAECEELSHEIKGSLSLIANIRREESSVLKNLSHLYRSADFFAANDAPVALA